MSEPNRKRRWYRLAAVLLILLLGFGTYRLARPDPNLKKVKQLQQEFAAHGKEWSPDERQAKGREMRQAMQNLSASQRDALAAERRKEFEQRLRQYAQMSAADKTRYLDEQINRSEQMRQQFANRNANGNSNGPRPGGGPGAFGAGPGGPGGPGGNLSAEEREKRRKERLNQTSPEFRALMDQFRKDMNARRQQRGLPVRG
jgi:exonuclease VII large subunit